MAPGNADRQHGHLPVETDKFVGREAELRLIGALLSSARLVTLTGPGGVGKTRVGFRAAAAAAGRFRDGVCVVEMSALRDPALLPHTVAQRLGLPESTPEAARDRLLAYLGGRRLLLILNTCEHLIEACADLAVDILAMAPEVTVLATSREALDVAGESICPILPLPVPDYLETLAPPAITHPDDTAAIELFAARAAAVEPGFALDDASRPDVVRLCRALDGVPLAIELAARRLRELSLSELANRTHSRLELLIGGPRGRHATSRAAIAWSYDLCTPTERTLWARLSVFPGSFDATAAIEVCADPSHLPGADTLRAAQVYETIIRLVDKSVLMAVAPTAGTYHGAAGDAAGYGSQPARFRMLDTIREFGAERLAAAGGETAARDRHLARYLGLARYIKDHLLDDDQLARFAALDRQEADIRAALEYALDGPRIREDTRLRDGAELAISLYTYWMAVSKFQEGKYWLGKVRDRFPGETPQRAWALSARSYLSGLQGDTASGIADGREAVALAERLGEPLITARAYLNVGISLLLAGRYDETATVNKLADEQLSALGDRTGLLMLCTHDGQRCSLTGHPEQTLAWLARFERDFGASEDQPSKEQWLHGWIHLVGAMAFFMLPGRDDECRDMLLRGLREKHAMGDTSGIAYALEILGWLALRGGRYARASWLLGAADPLWDLIGVRVSGTPAMEELHQQTVAACRDALGAAGLDALAAKGARLPLDRAVALAVADADDPDQDPDARVGA